MIRSTYTRAQWEAELRNRGCEPAEGVPSRPTGEFWRCPWPGAYPIFVPREEDGTMDGWALIALIKMLKEDAPPDWQV